MRDKQEIVVYCPYVKECIVKQKQKKNSARTELCILNYDTSECKLIQGGKNEDLHIRSNDGIQES